MPDLADGESIEVQGSAAAPYVLRNVGGVYSCTCPAWRNQGRAIESRSCKHLVKLRGAAAEEARTGAAQDRSIAPRRAPTVAGAAVEAGADDETAAASKAPPLLLAHPWAHDVDLAGWWMSEKLDGIRGYWDGQQFISRLGNRFFAPKWFVESMPDLPLDGELWAGRKKFQRTNGIVRRQDGSELWREISFLVFDAPALDAPFEERLEYLADTVAAAAIPHLKAHAHVRCEGVEHLKTELARVEALGGEGLMMRKPGSRYEVGRSHTLLKVKTFKDAEARVVDYVPGAGRHKGKVGALLLELPDGTRFSAGTGLSDAERASPPPKGAIVTFRYQELSDAGVPRFPTYVGVRHDFAWPEKATPELSRQAPGRSAEVPGRGTQTNGSATSPPERQPRINGEETAPTEASPEANGMKKGPVGSFKGSKGMETGASDTPSAAGRRTYAFEEGTSSKFWETWVEGARMFVRFGKLGSTGQTKVKDFASEAEARRASDALVAEKTNKGYRPA